MTRLFISVQVCFSLWQWRPAASAAWRPMPANPAAHADVSTSQSVSNVNFRLFHLSVTSSPINQLYQSAVDYSQLMAPIAIICQFSSRFRRVPCTHTHTHTLTHSHTHTRARVRWVLIVWVCSYAVITWSYHVMRSRDLDATVNEHSDAAIAAALARSIFFVSFWDQFFFPWSIYDFLLLL